MMFQHFDPLTGTRDSTTLHETAFRSYRVSFANGQMVTGLPFATRPLMALDRHRRVWVGTGEDYTLIRMNTSADTTLELRVTEAGVAVTPADIDTWKAGWDEYQDRAPNLISELMAYMPSHKPPLTQIFTDDQDRLWVGRTVPTEAHSRWDVFGVDGELLAVVRAPVVVNQYMQTLVVGDRIYMMVNGDAGERYIVVAELPGRLAT